MRHFINIHRFQASPSLLNMITYLHMKLSSHQCCCQVKSIDESLWGCEMVFSILAARICCKLWYPQHTLLLFNPGQVSGSTNAHEGKILVKAAESSSLIWYGGPHIEGF